MKTYGIIFLIIGLATCSLAQEINLHKNKFSLKPNKVELKSDISLIHFWDENTLKSWKDLTIAQNDFNNLNSENFKTKNPQIFTINGSSAFSSNMPIYKPDHSYFMPTMKPDTTVHYQILVKKIEVMQRNQSNLP